MAELCRCYSGKSCIYFHSISFENIPDFDNVKLKTCKDENVVDIGHASMK